MAWQPGAVRLELSRARHAHVGDASVPGGFDVGEGGEDEDVVF